MTECAKCGKEIKSEDAVKLDGKEVCEECIMKYYSPSRPCGGSK